MGQQQLVETCKAKRLVKQGNSYEIVFHVFTRVNFCRTHSNQLYLLNQPSRKTYLRAGPVLWVGVGSYAHVSKKYRIQRRED